MIWQVWADYDCCSLLRVSTVCLIKVTTLRSPLQCPRTSSFAFYFIWLAADCPAWLQSRVSTTGITFTQSNKWTFAAFKTLAFWTLVRWKKCSDNSGPAHKKPLNMALMRLHYIENQWGMKLEILRRVFYQSCCTAGLDFQLWFSNPKHKEERWFCVLCFDVGCPWSCELKHYNSTTNKLKATACWLLQ